jgi:hypothetical protein
MSKQTTYGHALPRFSCKIRLPDRKYLILHYLLVKISKQRSYKDERHGNGPPWRSFVVQV